MVQTSTGNFFRRRLHLSSELEASWKVKLDLPVKEHDQTKELHKIILSQNSLEQN